MTNQPKLFRRGDSESVKEMLNPVEGISFQENPLDFFILLARYKFAARFLKKNHRVVDAGCGQGFGSVFLARSCESVVGMDYDDGLVAANNERYASTSNLSFVQGDLRKPPEALGDFDALVSMDVIEHFTVEEQEEVFVSYQRLMKPRGFAVIGTPSSTSAPFASQRRRESHVHEFSPEEFETRLQKHFGNVFLFSMTDENVSTSFVQLAWYLMAICVK